MMSKIIYLDHASFSPLSKKVRDTLFSVYKKDYTNPNSLHSLGIHAFNLLDEARSTVAQILETAKDEIIFTASGTESDVIGILGVVEAWKGKGIPHIVTTQIEHPAVLHTIKKLEERGRITATYVSVNKQGIVDVKEIKESITEDTILISVMYANNEIGTIQPIQDIAKTIRFMKKQFGRDSHARGVYPLFHSDAAQATPYLSLRIPILGVDLFSFNATKMYGPAGCGVLYVKKGTPIDPIITGGGQEFGLRSGTENVPLCIGLATALSECHKLKEKEYKRLKELQTYAFQLIKDTFKEVIINGDIEQRLPNNINLSFKNVDSDVLVLYLDKKGIKVSSRSACSSKDRENSHVLSALDKELATYGSIRISMGRSTNKQSIRKTIQSIKEIVDNQLKVL